MAQANFNPLFFAILAGGFVGGCRETANPIPMREDGPKFRAVLLVSDVSVRCSAECTAQQQGGVVNCGPTEGQTQLRWKYVGRKPDVDLYELHWDLYPDRMPSETQMPVTTSLSKMIEYAGTPLVALEHGTQRVVVHSRDPQDPPTIDGRTPRSP
jgi:hypothetical protein